MSRATISSSTAGASAGVGARTIMADQITDRCASLDAG
jgi:hypothetical protein